MPRLVNAVPKYRHHKATGQAVVTLNGRCFYLGRYGSRPSRREYERLVGEWLAGGRRLTAGNGSLSMAELLAAYRRFAERYYTKDGRPTGTVHSVRAMLKLVREVYGDSMAADFGPLALKALQERMIERGWSRSYCNDQTARIKRMFKWAVSEELIPAGSLHALQAVSGLRKGRTEAHEPGPVQPVTQQTVDATLRNMSPVVAAMVRLQRLTGCRPGEVCALRPCDVCTAGQVWEYRPASHKTEHHGRDRVIFIGPQAQDILRPYLLRPADSYCFSPAESERKRLAERHEQRVTPFSCGNRPGTNCKRRPKRTPGNRFTSASYARAISYACDKAFPAPDDVAKDAKALRQWQAAHRWSPNRLRHSAATEIRRRYGIEAAQLVLGHAKADITQVYAERDLAKAAAIIREVG
jgi:integrase